ncbi:hypothetical protein JHV666_03000 [Mycobacterium avium subsp. hominissuis]|uniref:ATP-binding protein n=1 Tax=Mycobacterium avium TaxID=1764 RepID=UPI0022B768EF|nr:ATP-binding protein [Mycobacterium avium]
MPFIAKSRNPRLEKPLRQPVQLPQPGRIQHRHNVRLLALAEHIGGIGADRARRPIRQHNHQEQYTVPALKRPCRQQTAEQWMRRHDHPHLARQHCPQLLQSVAFTPGTGKTHLAIGLAIKAAQAGHRIAFATAVDWVARLKAAHNAGRLPAELVKLRRIGLLVVDEVGYIPFEQDAANLFFQLVSSRYEHASLILTSNLPFARWGDVFGDQVVAAAMIDRIVHHAEVLTLKGSSYRLKDTGIDTLPSARADNTAQ